jgi:Ca2+-binding RTX toxin-like protein
MTDYFQDLAEGSKLPITVGYFNGEQIHFTYTVTYALGSASESDLFVDYKSGGQVGGSFSFGVFTVGDLLVEPDETFTVTVSGTYSDQNLPYSHTWHFTIKDVRSPTRDEAVAAALARSAKDWGAPTDENMQDFLEYARSQIIDLREKDPLNTELRDAERYILGVETTGDSFNLDVIRTRLYVHAASIYEGLKFIAGQHSTLMRANADIPNSAPGGILSTWDGYLEGTTGKWKERIPANPGKTQVAFASAEATGGTTLFLRGAGGESYDFDRNGVTYHVASIGDVSDATPGAPLFDEIGGSYSLSDGADRLFASASANVELGAGNDVAAFSAASEAHGGDGSDIIVLSDEADRGEGDGGDDLIAGNGGADLLGGGAGDDVLDGGAGDDRLVGGSGDDLLFAGAGADRVEGSEGNDGAYFGAALDALDSFDGGAGNDTLAIQGATHLTLGDIANVEVLYVMSGSDPRFGDAADDRYDYDISTVDGNVAAGATLSVIATGLLPGEDLRFDGSAESDGNFRIFAGQGVDDLRGGAGSDGFFFGADGNLMGIDHVDGGAGIDTLALRGNYVGNSAVAFQNASFANIEVLALLSSHTNEYSGQIIPTGFDYDVTMAEGNVAGGQHLDVVAGLLGPDESVRFDGRAETNGSFRIFSGAGDDTLWGGGQGDMLYGGLGADQLNGGGGADTYVYRSVLESTAAARDGLSFSSGDRIDLHLIDANATTGDDDSFAFIGGAAFSAAGQLRAWQDGVRWIVEGDVDGDGAADLVIAVTGVQSLSATDFVL